MKTLTKTAIVPAGAFVTLRVEGVTEKVDRCYLTEDKNQCSLDITGKGRDEAGALRHLRKRVSENIGLLESKPSLKPHQVRRLDLLKAFLAG